MKNILIVALVSLVSNLAQANTLASKELNISPALVDKVIRLVDKQEGNDPIKKVSVIVADLGLSTDVSPTKQIFLGYSSLAEMGNISMSFDLGTTLELISAKRVSAGIYEVKTKDYRSEEGMVEVTRLIDATQMFVDEKEARKKCGDDFCDISNLKTTISVKETIKK